jgi:hypothetical protein
MRSVPQDERSCQLPSGEILTTAVSSKLARRSGLPISRPLQSMTFKKAFDDMFQCVIISVSFARQQGEYVRIWCR